MDKLVVKELIQHDLTIQNLEKELSLLVNDQNKISSLKHDYTALKKLLRQGGDASAKAAKSITGFLAAKMQSVTGR